MLNYSSKQRFSKLEVSLPSLRGGPQSQTLETPALKYGARDRKQLAYLSIKTGSRGKQLAWLCTKSVKKLPRLTPP